jgi:hypothetical protein
LDWGGHIKLIDLGLCKKVEFEKISSSSSSSGTNKERAASQKAQKEEAALNIHAEEAQRQLESGVTRTLCCRLS